MKEFIGPILKKLDEDIKSSSGVYVFGDVSECISEIPTVPLCFIKWSEHHVKYILKLFMHFNFWQPTGTTCCLAGTLRVASSL